VDSEQNTEICQRGHPFDRINTYGNKYCGTCHKISASAYEKNQKRKRYKKAYMKGSLWKQYTSEYYKIHKEDFKAWHLQNKYGLSMADYRTLEVEQGGRCAICGILGTETKKGLVVDHNHKTGKVRGLLCNICNSHIVHVLEDYPGLIEKAKAYLGDF
jgi:hypothetical protein